MCIRASAVVSVLHRLQPCRRLSTHRSQAPLTPSSFSPTGEAPPSTPFSVRRLICFPRRSMSTAVPGTTAAESHRRARESRVSTWSAQRLDVRPCPHPPFGLLCQLRVAQLPAPTGPTRRGFGPLTVKAFLFYEIQLIQFKNPTKLPKFTINCKNLGEMQTKVHLNPFKEMYIVD
jgi:hypothetical protein